MPTLVTNGIEIMVVPTFNYAESDILRERFVFRYTVRITNLNSFSVRLVKRKWLIFDSMGTIHEVQGDGVIGQQPLIEAGEVHQYDSWSFIKSEVGEMHGSYYMEKEDGETFWVDIPVFELIYPGKLN